MHCKFFFVYQNQEIDLGTLPKLRITCGTVPQGVDFHVATNYYYIKMYLDKKNPDQDKFLASYLGMVLIRRLQWGKMVLVDL